MGAAWVDVALEDMRIRGATNYATSYAPNEARPFGRRANGNQSTQYTNACLVQGRYPTAAGFTVTNPDYNAQLSYLDAGAIADLSARTWGEILPWCQLYCGEPWNLSHAPGWIDNSRVVMWDWRVYVKSLTTGQWVAITTEDDYSGHNISPPFDVEYVVPVDQRVESSGYRSVRLVYGQNPTYASAPYWAFHGYAGGVRSLNQPGLGLYGANDVADVVVSAKAALVVNSTTLADDRDYSRFTLAFGADYYPTPRNYFYPSVGCSRHKLVRAKFPQYQYFVMHTMTQAQLGASNGYPSVFANAAETYGDTGTAPPSLVVPSRGNWFAKLTSSANTWSTWEASSTAAPVWVTSTLPAAVVGQTSVAQVNATGTPAPTYSKVSGSSWATVSSAGVVTYTPDGNGSIVVRATNSAGTADQTFTITAASAPAAVSITSGNPPAFVAGTASTFQFFATGSGTITWTATALPSWATLSTGGLLTVSSAVSSQARIDVTATNGTTSDTRSYLVTVAALTPPATPTDNWTRVNRDTQEWTPV